MTTVKQLEERKRKIEERINKRIEKLQDNCQHNFERYSGYAGTDYKCKKCGLWK